jgi:pimeloyl-ACP methyl ester carboxylesterase
MTDTSTSSTAQTEWAKGFKQRFEGSPAGKGIQRASYTLKHMAERGHMERQKANSMLLATDLEDFGWHIIWHADTPTPDDALPGILANAEGYVIFIHGWTGSNAIWEDMPGMVVAQNPRLVCLAVDHNGFGDTPYADRTPEFEECSPPGAMFAIERWFDLLGLKRESPCVYNFVGHSMGGAALFFLNESKWNKSKVTRIAIAPALLLEDQTHRAFFQSLGLGIGLVGRLNILETIERLVSPRVLERLAEGATRAVLDEHMRIYSLAPRSVTARTFAAMGVIKDYPKAHEWGMMTVFLGHRDALVGLTPMMDLLNDLGFDNDQVRVKMGTHYMFSVGESWARTHAQTRTAIVDEILYLHRESLQAQQSDHKSG